MDDIIDELVAETANDNLDEIIQVASAIVGSQDVPDVDDPEEEEEEDDDQDDDTDRQIMAENMVNGETPTRVSGPPSSEEDNMDYDSDDDDDSKSNNSCSNQNRNNHKKRLKGEVKRSHHNVLERKRRDLIKDSFTKLKEAVPTLSSERASRAQILKKAADFIQAQHLKNESSRADLRDLIKKNAELENKINSRPQVTIIKQELNE